MSNSDNQAKASGKPLLWIAVLAIIGIAVAVSLYALPRDKAAQEQKGEAGKPAATVPLPVATALPVTPSPPTSEPLRIGYSKLSISLPIFVAKERGFFASNGIEAQLEVYEDGQLVGQALVEGKVDVGGYLATPISFNGIQRTGRQMYFVSSQLEDRKHPVSYLLRRKTPAGQEPLIKTVADLKGKKVGIFPTLAYKRTLEAILKVNGVNPEEVTIQQTEAQLQAQLLSTGAVDAIYTVTPPGVAILGTGSGELIEDDVQAPKIFGEPFPFSQFLIGKEWADAHPDLTRRVVRALDQAIVYINANPVASKELYRLYLGTVHHKFIGIYPEPLYLTSVESTEAIYGRIAAKYLEIGIITKPFDITGLIYHGDPVSAR